MIPAILLFVAFIFVAWRFKNATNYSQYPPGPISFPIIGSILALTSKPHEKLSQMKKKYGNIIAIDFGSVRGIVLNDLDTIKNVLSLKEIQIRPALEALCIIRGKERTVLGGLTTNEEQRAFVLKTLKNFGMGKKSIECLIADELQRLFATLDQQLDTPIINKGLFQLSAVSALWSLMTGENGKVEDSDFINLLQKISKAGRGSTIFTFLSSIFLLFPNWFGWNDYIKGFAEMDECASKSIQAHKMVFDPDAEPKDLIEAYLHKIESTEDENSSFFGKTGDKNLVSVVSDFLAAGTETISSTLTWLFPLLIYYLKVQEKAQLEIDRVIGRNRLPSLKDRTMLPYNMESLVFEILRFSAIIPLGVPRETAEDVKIGKYVIPKGTVFMTNAYDALYDKKLWNEPEEFKPERFLTQDGSAVDRNIARNVDVVFGHGKRMCPGEKLAKDELFIFITGLCQRYRFMRDPLRNYEQKIRTELGLTLVPRPYSLIIQKR